MAESFFSHLLKGARIVVAEDVEVKGVGSKIGQRIGGGLRSAPAGMAFVDVTGRVDADADGIVFEGLPLERPIIPKFLVPKELAGKLSRLVEGDSMEIEKQRRAGNTNIEFNEDKFNNLVASLEKGKTSTSTKPDGESGMASRSGSIDWNKPDLDWGDGQGGMVTSWDLPDGGHYTVYDYEGLSGQSFSPEVAVYAANNEEILKREFSSRNEAMGFLKNYHEGVLSSNPGMSSSRDLSETKWKGAKPKEADINLGADLSGADLTGLDLRNRKFNGTNFSSAKLFNTDLTGADLRRADFTSADLRLAKLESANLSNAFLDDANLYNANLTGAMLIDAKLRGANLKNANFEEADLNGANLQAADLSNANLSNSDLRNANLFGAIVGGVDFTGAEMPDLSDTVILGADRTRGMSSRNSGMLSTTELSRRDRAKLETFIEEATRSSHAKSSNYDNQEAFQEAILELMDKVNKEGIGYLDKFINDSREAERIKSLIDDGNSDESIMKITGATEQAINNVRQFGASSPGKIFIARSIGKQKTNVERDRDRQMGGIPKRRAAEQKQSNQIWDLIDSGMSDEDIIAAAQDMGYSKFNENRLASIKKEGRLKSDLGVRGMNTNITSLEALDERNSNRGIGSDGDVSADELDEPLGPEDVILSGSGVEAEGAAGVAAAEDEVFSRLQVANRQKVRTAEKIREALSESYDILDMKTSRRSTTTGREDIENREIASELGLSASMVQKHLALIDEIRKHVEDGSFADPDWMIPFDEIADIGRTTEGISQLAEKYDFPEPLMALLARQVSGHRRRLDARSAGADKAYQDFADQVNSLIKAGYTRAEIASMIPGVNSPQALQNRINTTVEIGLIEKDLMDSEVLNAIQKIRKDGIGAINQSMVEKLRALGVNVDDIAAMGKAKKIVELSPEENEFQSLRSGGKSKQEIMDLMNIDKEQYQRLYSRMKMREKR